MSGSPVPPAFTQFGPLTARCILYLKVMNSGKKVILSRLP